MPIGLFIALTNNEHTVLNNIICYLPKLWSKIFAAEKVFAAACKFKSKKNNSIHPTFVICTLGITLSLVFNYINPCTTMEKIILSLLYTQPWKNYYTDKGEIDNLTDNKKKVVANK